jgi:DNA invertase Pin-like site-specific DNA recombinase
MTKVAAYCRVSTDKSDQVNSLENQKKYFRDYIERNPLWELTGVYVDEGISGTSTKKRHAFNQMIHDAKQHKYDLIITKEISRFARNTLDSIYYTRKLKDFGIGVLFMNDNINTLDTDAELRLTIMSSIAQEESRKTSNRVKWGQKRSMENGVVFGRDLLGYDVKEGCLHINEEGAEVVRLIFHKFVMEGKGTHIIARELTEAGIPTVTNKYIWHNNTILRILRNEKYCGDLIQKKTYTPSYLTHEKKYNTGEEELVVLKNHHEPIISRELFNQAQSELESRSVSPEQKKKYSNRFCFSGKITCGICGSSYVARSRRRKDGTINRTWRCYTAVNYGNNQKDKRGNEIGCESHGVNEELLQRLLIEIIKDLNFNKKEIRVQIINTLKSNLSIKNKLSKKYNLSKENDLVKKYSSIIVEEEHESYQKLVKKKNKLIDLYMDNLLSKIEFSKKSNELQKEITRLEKNLDLYKSDVVKCTLSNTNYEAESELLDNIINGDLWSDTFYNNIIEEIVIYKSKIVIKLKYISSLFTFRHRYRY